MIFHEQCAQVYGIAVQPEARFDSAEYICECKKHDWEWESFKSWNVAVYDVTEVSGLQA